MELKTIICKGCNEEHNYPLRQYNQRIKNNKKPKQFCSRKCADNYRQKNKLNPEVRVCIVCETKFEAHVWTEQKCCSRKCADKIRHGTNEQVYGRCANLKCNAVKNSNHVLCKKCRDEGRRNYKRNGYRLPDELTKGEAIKRSGANRFDAIRAWARKKILDSNIELKCEECGYDKHVEIAHIKSISSFPEDSMISEINSFDNLKLLCPNCHWEFDHQEEQ